MVNMRARFLRFRSRIYVSVLVFLSFLSIPFLNSCHNGNSDKECTNATDSSSVKIRELEAQLKAKDDSLRASKSELGRVDSLKKIKEKQDSIARTKQQNPKYAPTRPAVDYGVLPVERPSINKN
jgi:hypothetical protein